MKLWKDIARARNARGAESGQAMIEFVVMVMVILFFLLFMLSMAMLLVVSDYVEFATFMAARTYKSGFSGEARQEANAKLVFDKYFEFVQGIARNPNIEFRKADEQDNQTAGLLVSYDMDLFYLPPIFVGGDQPPSRIRLVSEAHLGRDPTFNEVCDPQSNSFFSRFLQQQGINNAGNIAEQMDDNGC